MFRYVIQLSGTKSLIKTKSVSDNYLLDQTRYIQFLGISKSSNTSIISFWELPSVDLSSLKGYHPVLIRRNGIPKTLTSLVISIKKEEI